MVATNPKRGPLKAPHGDPYRFAGKNTIDTPHSPLKRWTTPAVPVRPLPTPSNTPATHLVQGDVTGGAIKPSEMPKARTRDRARVRK